MNRLMGITTKLTLFFFLFAILILASVGGLAYYSGHNALDEAVISDLTAMATEKHAALDTWVDHSLIDVGAIAASPELQRSLNAFLIAYANLDSTQSAHDQIVAALQPWAEGGRFFTLMVIEPRAGRVVAATNPREEGTYRENRSYFVQGLEGPYVRGPYYSLHLQQVAMTASAPILSENGEVLGVLAARLNLEDIEAIISRRTERHASDDTYLVDTSRLPVTRPRLVVDEDDIAGGIQTEQVERCLDGESGVLLADDYRDIPVIAVYQWLPDHNLCLIVELDQAEAYAPTRAFGLQLLLIALLALLLAGGIAIRLARTITKPILALKQSVTRFAQGDLSVRLSDSSRDELGLLAREFNAMAIALETKEKELRQQAEELGQANIELEQALVALSESKDRFRQLAQENADLAETKAKLLHEINHRVKNNLAAIIGLLYAETNRPRIRHIPEFQTVMKDLIARVRGLASVHDLLSDSNWTPLLLVTLVDRVASTTVRALSLDKETFVDIASDADVYVELDQAHSIAIIINELTTNTLKYTQDQTAVHIHVTIADEGDAITLTFRDQGPGYPPAVTRMEDLNVGLRLVHHIVTKNLGGELSLESDGGAVTIIRLVKSSLRREGR